MKYVMLSYRQMFHFKVLNQVTPNPKETNSKVALKNKAKNRSLTMNFIPSEILHACAGHNAYMHVLYYFIIQLINTE